MPLSTQMKQACQQATMGLQKDPLLSTQASNKNRESILERDLLYFNDFFLFLLNTPENVLQDNDVLNKLFEALEDYKIEQRGISESSYRLKAVIQVFLKNLEDHPLYSLIKENFDQLLANQPVQKTNNIEQRSQQFVEKYKIIVQSYLNSLEVVEDNSVNQIKKYASMLYNTEKTIKTANNPKVIAMKNIAFNLDLIRNEGKYILYDQSGNMQIHAIPENASLETILEITEQVIKNELEHQKLPAQGKGQFYSTISLLTSDIQSELSTSKTLGPCPEETYNQISEALTQQLSAESKTVRRFEPAHIFQNSSSATIANVFTQEAQKFGGEDQVLVITSIRQNINPELHQRYENKKQEFANKKIVQPCTDVHSLNVEQENLEPNEVLLLHGTSVNASKNIFKTGFRDPSSSSYLSTFGALGSAIYFTDNYLKAGTFSTCSLCGKVQCGCTISPDQKVERCVIINKVAMGNTYTTLDKRNIPQGYDSAVGISKADNSKSTFNSSEIGITSSDQVLPMFEVKYFTYENMMKLSKWPKDVPALERLLDLIDTVENFGARHPAHKQEIKKECEQLLANNQLDPNNKKKVTALLDQVNIENTYPNNRIVSIGPSVAPEQENQGPAAGLRRKL